MESRVKPMEMQLAKWGARLDELIIGARQADGAVEINYRKSVEDLKAKFHIAQFRLDQFRAGQSNKLDALKADVERAWQDLEIAFKRMAN